MRVAETCPRQESWSKSCGKIGGSRPQASFGVETGLVHRRAGSWSLRRAGRVVLLRIVFVVLRMVVIHSGIVFSPTGDLSMTYSSSSICWCACFVVWLSRPKPAWNFSGDQTPFNDLAGG